MLNLAQNLSRLVAWINYHQEIRQNNQQQLVVILLSTSFCLLLLLAIIVPSQLNIIDSTEEYDYQIDDFYQIAIPTPDELDNIPPDILTKSQPPTQQEAPLAKPEAQWLIYKIKRGDTLDRILKKINADPEAIKYLTEQKFKTYRKLRVGSDLFFQQEQDTLLALRYKTNSTLYFNFRKNEDGTFSATEEAPEFEIRRKTVRGIISQSLFHTSESQGIQDAVILSLVQALDTRIDFHRDLRPNDYFVLVYDEIIDSQGEFLGIKQLHSFRFHNKKNTIDGYYFPDKKAFYQPDGSRLQNAFLRSPLKFSRISSRFTNRRFHPVLKKWRAHRGVDYAARRGTPVRSTADGKISFIGKKGGYGNVIFIKHFNVYTTVYGHLHNFAKGLKKGSTISQGQVIAYVGSTGQSTGPHLHYEFRVRGVHKDPLSTAVPINAPALDSNQFGDLQAFVTDFKPIIDEQSLLILSQIEDQDA